MKKVTKNDTFVKKLQKVTNQWENVTNLSKKVTKSDKLMEKKSQRVAHQ